MDLGGWLVGNHFKNYLIMSFYINSKADYEKQYELAKLDPRGFFADIAKNFHWFSPWSEVLDYDFDEPRIEWFKGGKTNISYNCLDRHLVEDGCDSTMKDKVAIIFEPNDPSEKTQKITYQQLHHDVAQFANLLIAQGVKAGDRVCIYMPMIPQAAVAMLACARIGAVHSVVFAGFSASALSSRIVDSQAKILITADWLFRGDKKIELFEIAAEALSHASSIENVILYLRDKKYDFAKTLQQKNVVKNVIVWQKEVAKYDADAPIFHADSNHPLFILYTSGSTGKPKGIVHAHGGYMVYTAYSFKNIFQHHFSDIFFCSADIGWITGHSYLVYAPLLNGATTLMFEGVPTHPTFDRFWQIIEKHKVTIFYTAPTAIRALMKKGDEFVKSHNLQSLKTLGSVGEPINQEAWQWYHDVVGGGRCPIVDTWWQTETGAIMISTMAGITSSKPAHAGLPFCGVQLKLLDDDGVEILEPNKTGNLCITTPWPSMAQGVWGDKKKFYETYFSRFKGYYFTGDGAFVTEDGLYRITGRVDDVLNVSGHRIGTAEIENIVNMHENIAESAVVGFAHEIKGEGICVFAIAKKIPQDPKALQNEIIELIKREIGAIAKPDRICIVSDLPKTRSGKIMRRILKKIVAGEKDLGDVSTLINPNVAEEIVGIWNK